MWASLTGVNPFKVPPRRGWVEQLRGESAELLSRELGLPIFKLEQWRQKAEAALERALKTLVHNPGRWLRRSLERE